MYRTKKDPKRGLKLVKSLVPKLVCTNKTSDYRKDAALVPDYLASSKAASTSNNYYLAFKRFENFCSDNNIDPVPSSGDDLLVYFVKLSEETQSTASAVLYKRLVLSSIITS